ncbi:MAG: hypothetical protein JRJ79_02280 [Deltaproteobacteria bacterium]|nr:hypothetical protein [Deltaproteobacteria bacterium]MBW2340395.1 hypothetical protein [Deltaproteobacteria bacterium]
MKYPLFQKPLFFLSVLLLMSLIFVLFITHDINAEEPQRPCLDPKINTIVPNAAKPGEQIRIRGVRFGREPGEVGFSPGIKGQIKRWGNKVIYVIVPESATSGPVTVSIPCGSVSNEKDFMVKEQSE